MCEGSPCAQGYEKVQCSSDGDEAHDLTPQLHAELRGKGQPEVARQTFHENHRRSANAVDARVHQPGTGVSEPIRECSSLLDGLPQDGGLHLGPGDPARVGCSQVCVVHMAPPCRTCSKARGIPLPGGSPGPPTLRSVEHPWGTPWVVGVDRVKLDASNAVHRVLAKCVDVCDKLGVPWCIENPTNS